MATITNLYVDQGSDYASIMTLTGPNGQALNLTGYTVKSQMRKHYTSSTSYDFTCTIVDALTGQIQISMSATVSTPIKAGRYLYDVEITNTGSGAKKRVVEGAVILTGQITQI